MARAHLYRSETPRHRRDDVSGRRLCARSHRVRFELTDRPRLAKGAGQDQRGRTLPLWRAGGEPRSRRRGDDRGGEGARGLRRLSVRLDRRGGRLRPAAAGKSAGDRRRGQSELPRPARQAAVEHRPAGSADHGAHGRARRPRRRAQDHRAGHAERQHDRHQAAILRPLAGRRRQCRFRRCHHLAGWRCDDTTRLALRAVAHRDPLSILQARRQLELRAGQDHQARRQRHDRHDAR
jgi:hypothetical protein